MRASAAKFAPPSTSLLEWSWALELLMSSRTAWLSTVTPDGRPHVAPLWLVVADEAVWFWTPTASAKGRNLVRSDAIALHIESGDDIVIIDGHARRTVPTPNVLRAFASKYESAGPERSEFWKVDVVSALAWRGHLGRVQREATRFTAE